MKGRPTNGRKFSENSQTIVINAHGGLIYLSKNSNWARILSLSIRSRKKSKMCRVVYLGDTSEKGTRVGVEFLSPSPHFWGVEFAQQDWNPPLPPRPVN